MGDKTVVEASPFQKFLDKKKKTVIVMGSGLTGIAQVAYLHSLNKYNVIMVTSDDEELLPPYMTVMEFPKFDTDVNYRHFGINGYFPWFVNGLYTYLIGHQEDERVYHKVEENYDIFE